MNVEPNSAADRGSSPKYARASVVLGVLSFFLLFASMLHGRAWSLWRLPFVFGMFPVSVLPYAALRLGALLAALTAVLTGVAAMRRRARVLMAVFGTLAGRLTVALIGHLTFSYFSTVRDDVDLTACGKNLRYLNRDVLWKYIGTAEDFYPPLSPQPGVLMFSPKAIPSDESVGRALTCPTICRAAHPATGPASPFDDQSYFYLGYALRNDDEVEAFAQAYRKHIAAGGTFEADLPIQTAEGTRVLHRLRKGVENLLGAARTLTDKAAPSDADKKDSSAPVPPDVQGQIPVFIERGFGHVRI
jgi:hypothetical protein